MTRCFLFSLLFFTLSCSHLLAQGPLSEKQLVDGHNLKPVKLSDIVAFAANKPAVFVLGEIHDQACHHANHLELIKELEKTQRVIHVGLEFISYTFQEKLDQYNRGELNDEEFQKAVEWGEDFHFYKPKIKAPLRSGGQALAINAPRSLSFKIARSGLDSLNEQEKALLPPEFSLGNAAYFERFKQVMSDSSGGHQLPPQALQNYFASQSLWDDTMAYQVSRWREFYPDDHIVIIVGDFHVIYGGGLPDRLAARGLENIVTLSQDKSQDSPAAKSSDIIARADFIWTCP